MARFFTFSLFAALFFLSPSKAAAQRTITDFSALLEPSPQALSLSRLQNLSDTQIMRYGFLFSGLSENQLTSYLNRYEELARNLNVFFVQNGLSVNDLNPAAQKKKAEAVLDFLFSGFFKKYSLTQTRLDTLFDSGVYNCVSSAVVYYALCVRSGIEVRAVKTRDHAFCAVTIGALSIDVETTNKYGFDPGNKKEFTNSFGQTGFAYVPPSNYRGRTDITDKELLCLILQNRAAELQKKRDFAATVKLAADCNVALQTPESLKQLYIECGNYAAALDMSRRYEEALDFLTLAANRYGAAKLLADTADKLYYNLFVTTFEKKAGISAAAQIELGDKLYAFYAPNTLISQKIKRDVLILLYNQKARELFTAENWTELLTLLEKAKRETGGDPAAVRLENNTTHNIGVLFHNKFASFFNKGDREAARAVLEEGLSLVPADKTLLNDREQLKKLK